MFSPLILLAAAQGPEGIPGLVTNPWVQLTSSPTGMVVEFITHDNPKITVEAPGFYVKKIENMVLKTDDLQLQKFLIGGLKPDTDFTYSLVKGTDRIKYTAHAPKDTKATARLAIFGSSGLGTEAQKQISSDIQKMDPDLIVHVGDVAFPFGQEPSYIANHFGVYGSILSRTPVAAAAGSHDTTYRDFEQYPGGLAYYKFFNLPKEKQPWARDLGNYSFTYGNALWLILDSNTYNNFRDPKAQAWVKQELAKGAKLPWRFVAFHHAPYHSSKVHEEDTRMQVLDPIFQQARVSFVFGGQVHNYQRAKPTANSPIYIVTGAAGSELNDQDIAADKAKWKPFTQVFAPGFSYTQFFYSNTKAFLKQIDSEGKAIDSLEISAPAPAPETKKPTTKPASKKKKKGKG